MAGWYEDLPDWRRRALWIVFPIALVIGAWAAFVRGIVRGYRDE
jgi:hypothetical protein